MNQEFHREDRYIVIKHKDLGNVPVAYREHLVRPLFALQAHLPVREYVVVERDWPEYETVWRMIEARVTGVTPAGVETSIQAKRVSDCPAERLAQCRGVDIPPASDGVDFGIDGRSVRVSQEAYSIFIAREQMGKDRVAALQQRLNIADQRVCNLQSELNKALSLVRWFYTHANVHQVGTVMMDAARDFIAQQSAPAARVCSHIWVSADNRGVGAGEICQACSEHRPAAKLDASMIGIVHTPPMEYDEP